MPLLLQPERRAARASWEGVYRRGASVSMSVSRACCADSLQARQQRKEMEEGGSVSMVVSKGKL